MIDFLRKAPFLRFVLLVITGIVFRMSMSENISVFRFLFVLTVILWFGLVTLNKISKNHALQWIFGLVVYVSFFLSGIYICDLRISQIQSQHFPENRKIVMKCVLKENPVEKAKSYKFLAHVSAYLVNDSLVNCNNKLVLYVAKESRTSILKQGDVLMVRANPALLESSQTKGFDYAKYMFKQGVKYSAYASKNYWVKVDSCNLSVFENVGLLCKNKLLGLFAKAGLKGRDFAVTAALTIGYKAELDTETRRAYSSSGTMHILAVSGLHVGILFMVLNILLGFLDRYTSGKVIKSILIILIIWFYAFLTGLSPSILRATLMLTFICSAQIVKRKSFIYNSIAISAFIILLYNPLQITDVGFQLSYAAVLAIVIFYPLLYKLVKFKNVFLDNAWQLTAVSIAAQIGTFPLSLFYFNQFPVFFILSNLLAIPISTFSMYLAFLMLSTSFVSVVFYFLGNMLHLLVNLLNSTVFWIEQLPYSNITDITLSASGVVIWYLIIISGTLFLLKRKGLYLFLFLFFILCLQWIDLVNLSMNIV